MSESKAPSRRKFIRFIALGGVVIGVTALGAFEVIQNLKNLTSSTTSPTTSPNASSTTSRTTSSGSSSTTPPTTTPPTTTPTTAPTTLSTSKSTSGASSLNWSNLRGVCYPWEPLELHIDQRGAPDPEWSYPQFRNLGWNLVRMDSLSWGQYALNPSAFLSNLDRVVNAANANGVYNIWAFSEQYGNMPQDVQNAIPLTSWNNYWWSDSIYAGTNTSLQGLGIWEAMFKDFISVVIARVDSQPCTFGYKFCNEPAWSSGSTTTVLPKFYGVMGGKTRALGSAKYLTYEGPAGNTGFSSLVNQIPISNFRPAIYDVHYPTTTALATDYAACLQNNVTYWDGEDRPSDMSSSFLSALKQYNCASSIFRWDEDGDLLASGTGTTPGTVSQTAINLSDLQTQVLGPAQFFL